MTWKRRVTSTPAQMLWLSSFDDDVRSSQISFAGYVAAARRLLRGPKSPESANAAVLHHARAFVTAVRRVGRLLETVNRSVLPPAVAMVVKLQQQSRKQFFAQYVDIRNASEHVAEDVKDPSKYEMKGVLVVNPAKQTLHPLLKGINISQSNLEIATLGKAPVTQRAMNVVLSTRDAIVTAVLSHFPKRSSELLLLNPLDVTGFDDPAGG